MKREKCYFWRHFSQTNENRAFHLCGAKVRFRRRASQPRLEKQLSLFFPLHGGIKVSQCVCVCGRDSVHVCMKAQTCPHRKQAAVYYYAANEAV